ncbi:MAG TPA: C4-type zinc ribbon domain-containing protein [Elusimicrobiota bacterium]|nr:C4-type zinc ribbon domain-containing protein [Elusimicrobiota bacterium]
MNENITRLLALQNLDVELDHLQSMRDGVPPRRQSLQDDIQTLQKGFEDFKQTLVQLQLDKKNLELDIDAQEQQVRKSGSELNSVKTNEAYRALLQQIEGAKGKKNELEDKVLGLMESIEQFQRDQKAKEKEFLHQKEFLERQISALDEEDKKIQMDMADKKVQREGLLQALGAEHSGRYEAIRRNRQGMKVLVPVQSGSCGGCRMKLPPHLINEVRRDKEIVTCETCTRILYQPAPEPAAQP